MPQFAACPCQLCSQKIEFETIQFQPGTTATCPHCGMETILFIPPGAQSRSSTVENDGCIFKNGRVTVTPSLLTVGLSAFPIAAISSFRVIALPENRFLINVFNSIIGAGGLFGIFILAANASNDNDSKLAAALGWGLVVLAAIFLALRILAEISQKFRRKLTGEILYGLNIRTSAVEQTIISNHDIGVINAIGDALRQAISMRG